MTSPRWPRGATVIGFVRVRSRSPGRTRQELSTRARLALAIVCECVRNAPSAEARAWAERHAGLGDPVGEQRGCPHSGGVTRSAASQVTDDQGVSLCSTRRRRNRRGPVAPPCTHSARGAGREVRPNPSVPSSRAGRAQNTRAPKGDACFTTFRTGCVAFRDE